MSRRKTSSTMIIRKKHPVDPTIEALQREGERESNIPDGLPELKEKTSRIHLGWLFHVRGALALKRLMLTLHSTPDTPSSQSWSLVAFHLDIDTLTINCIKRNVFEGNTYTYYALLAAAQNRNKTLCDLLEALEQTNRLDAIQQSKEPIDVLATYVLENDTTSNSTDIIMPPELAIPPSEVLIPDEELLNRMTRPPTAADCTLLLKSPIVQKLLKALAQDEPIQQKMMQFTAPRVCEETLVRAVPTEERSTPKNNAKRMHYDCIIMLTFASDGEKYVPDIVDSLRRERLDKKQMGVLILEEHSSKVELNPQQFITTYFSQVHYVMPVITPGYLKSIKSPTLDIYGDPAKFLDTMWTQYIYRLMNLDYLRRGCLNKKVRCVVPDEYLHLVQTHKTMREPIFETWDRVSNIDNMGNRLLRNAKK